MTGLHAPAGELPRGRGGLGPEFEISSKRRGELDVIVDILTIASKPARRTKILYQANLNHRQMGRYLDLLVRTGYLAEHANPIRSYHITDKGVEFLVTFRETRHTP